MSSVRTVPLAGAILLAIALLFGTGKRVSAQLANSFYNITNIETKVLPNAVQVTISTDGDVKLGVDFKEYVKTDAVDFSGDVNFDGPLEKSSIRLRFAGARQKIPAFTEIGKYPVDSALVTLSRGKFQLPFFEDDEDLTQNGSGTPGVDIDIRFYVPITVAYFTFRFDSYYGWNFDYPVILKPREASIVVAADHRSVVITIMTDRAEQYRNPDRIRRSNVDTWKHSVQVNGNSEHFQISAVHTSLADTLAEIGRVSGLALEAHDDAAGRDVTLFLPDRAARSNLEALAVGLGLSLTPRTADQGGGFAFGQSGIDLVTERLPLKYLQPADARALFPDFLLPFIRVDQENNGLVATGSPELLAHLHRDLLVLDRAPTQVRVDVQAFELSFPDEAAFVLSGAVDQGRVGWNGEAGQVTVALQPEQTKAVRFRLESLIAKGSARLVAKPNLTVVSGHNGTLFLGQTRFISVLNNGYGGTTASILPLLIGTKLNVTPTTSGPDEEILLKLQPKLTTVDAIEKGTGLPTVGIRELNAFLRVRPGDTVLIGGLSETTHNATRRDIGPFSFVPGLKDLLGSRRRTGTDTSLILLVTARAVSSTESQSISSTELKIDASTQKAL